jgi:undecaprenyl-diphosphatase
VSLIEALILGVVQGLTEFLPVSSSGHLVLGGRILSVDSPGAGFEVLAHAGTLLAILIHYRRDLLGMAGSLVTFRRDEHFRLAFLVLLGSIPAAAVGLGFGSRLEDLFDRPVLAAAMLLVTGLILLSLRFAKPGSNPVRWTTALLIGCAQAFAILPGISRSGSTIVTGIHTGIDRAQAARFSFLLAIPALGGAALLKGLDLAKTPPASGELAAFAVGAVAAFVSGYLALRWLLGVISRGRLDRFGWYCLAVGAAALVWLVVLPRA